MVAYENGELILFNEEGDRENVGFVEEGLTGAEWSPDEQFLLLVTQNHHLVLMNTVEGHLLEIIS